MSPPPEDPRYRFAAERTLLAWLRTGLALMGFGFVVARFGLFLSELAVVRNAPAPATTGVSHWLGIAIVLVGVFVSVMAAVEYRRVIQRIDRQLPYLPPTVPLGLILAGILAVIGLGMAGYLVLV